MSHTSRQISINLDAIHYNLVLHIMNLNSQSMAGEIVSRMLCAFREAASIEILGGGDNNVNEESF